MARSPFNTRIIRNVDMRVFDELRARIDSTAVVKVGVPAGETEPDGTSMASVARTQEFGSSDGKVPERPFLRPSIRLNAHKYVRLNRINLVKIIRGEMTVDQALELLGTMAAGDVKKFIKTASFRPLAQATIRARERKRSAGYNRQLRRRQAAGVAIDRPLIDTGNLWQSITYVVEARENA